MNAIHLCCGAGGTTLGFERAGIKTAWAFDFAPTPVETHRVNFPEASCEVVDIRELTAWDIPAADVWTCGIPCEAYSIAGHRREEEDDRDISVELVRLIREAGEHGNAPQFVFLENVPPFAQSAAAGWIRDVLQSRGYQVADHIYHHADWGIPQKRRRWHLIANRNGPAPEIIPTHSEHPTLFGTSSWLTFGDIREETPEKPQYMSANALRGIIRRQRSKLEHALENGHSPYSTMVVCDDTDLLPTILASWGNGGVSRNQVCLIFDDYQFRMPTLLEVARAQGFPDDFVFCGTKKERWQQIGRAVPPPFAEAAARAMIEGQPCMFDDLDGVGFRRPATEMVWDPEIA